MCDNKLPELVVLRPLREITTKEVTFYNLFNELEFQAVPSLASLVCREAVHRYFINFLNKKL